MRKLSKQIIVFFLLTSASISCTDNERARQYGGTESIRLKPHHKFVNITWKNNDLWVIVQDTLTGTYYALEKSSYGLLEGKIIIEKEQSIPSFY